MVNENFLRQISEDLIRKLIKPAATIEITQKAFIVFCDETTDLLHSKVIKALPNEEVIATASIIEKTKELLSCKAVVLVAPSIDLVGKITNLQTDCPISALVVKALFANKRVLAIAAGPLAIVETLRVGLRKAVEDLRCKLVEMGIEFVDITELAQMLDNPTINTSETNNIAPQPPIVTVSPATTSLASTQSSISYSMPLVVYPISQHPSQVKIAAKDELSEFVDFLQTKQCTMEKGKPCDRCDICNTLGF